MQARQDESVTLCVEHGQDEALVRPCVVERVVADDAHPLNRPSASGLIGLEATSYAVHLRGKGVHACWLHAGAFIDGARTGSASIAAAWAANGHEDTDEQAQDRDNQSRDGYPAGY